MNFPRKELESEQAREVIDKYFTQRTQEQVLVAFQNFSIQFIQFDCEFILTNRCFVEERLEMT